MGDEIIDLIGRCAQDGDDALKRFDRDIALITF